MRLVFWSIPFIGYSVLLHFGQSLHLFFLRNSEHDIKPNDKKRTRKMLKGLNL